MRERTALSGCRLMRTLCAAVLLAGLAGCQVLNGGTASTSAPGSSLLNILARSSADSLPKFDPEQLRPMAPVPEVAADTLLEVTVWDLYELEKPHTFPVRVASDMTVAVPMVEPVAVAGLPLREIEKSIAARYRDEEILQQPRVLVRSLEPQTVRISVAGAVQQPGFLDLPRQDASVYSALLAAGGPRKGAGVHVGVSRPAAVRTVAKALPPESREDSPSSTANSLDVQEVAAVVETEEVPAPSTVTWYDVTKPEDCDALRKLSLGAGDSVIVKPAVAPLRIGGDIARPGPYSLPVASGVTLWQAVDMAGGTLDPKKPYQVALIRPARDGRPPQRWLLDVSADDKRPPGAPLVQPGDVVHVEHTESSSALKNLAGRLLP